MNMSTKLALMIASVGLVAPQTVVAQSVEPSAQWNGTWTLDTADSKFAAPIGKTTETRTYEITGNKVSLTSNGTDADGNAVQFTYSGAYDGKWYPMVGNPRGDSISLTLVNPMEAKAKVRKDGKETVTGTLTVSEDGKTLTLNRETLNAEGPPTVDVLVYDRAP
jgi:hypothetical protein